MPPALKPGVIPLRPLSLSDIFNGAFTYIRTNPKATLGLATVVVVAAQILALILQVGPLAAMGELGALRGDEASTTASLASSLSGLATLLTTYLSGIVLSGMLTVVVGRAVFGAGISIGEAWLRVRGRLLALTGFTLLTVVGGFVLVMAVFAVFLAVLNVNSAAAIAVGLLLGFGALALVFYLGTMLAFAAPLIVLERLGVFAAIVRSFKLVKGDFWRVLGIWLLAMIVAAVISGAVSIPFAVGGELMLLASETTMVILIAMVLIAIGGAVGQIIATPFSAGAVVLLYTDRRMRAEAFDLVLLTGAAGGPEAAPDSTDHLWLTRQP
jgi:Membrane domain of glycerophosphoryl diester phosphodiesterase